MGMDPASVIITGHYCHDTLYLANGTASAGLGGSASYISSVLKALGLGFHVVSKVGPDFLYSTQVSIPPFVIQGASTTHFIADFTQGERIARADAFCDPIYPKDLPEALRFEIALAVGIVGEVLPETLDTLAQCSRYVLCDMQGLIRVFDSQGHVGLQRLEETPFYSRLEKIAFLKASRQEAEFMDIEAVRQKTCVLITEGDQGCTVYTRLSQFRVPAFSVLELDPTGAGDCFLAGFTAGLLRGLPLEKAVLLGNYFGSLAVGQVGVPKISLAEAHQGFERVEKESFHERLFVD
jgi:1D-myo-inositol 3-kinase